MKRREFVIGTSAGAALLFAPGLGRRAALAAPAAEASVPTLDPTSIPLYVTPLVIPPAMPRTSKISVTGGKNVDYYEIAVRQFQQQILPPGLPATTVWSYGSVNQPGTFNYPAFTIEAKWQAPGRVKWINDLVDAQRQLSAAPAAGRPDAALGQPAGRRRRARYATRCSNPARPYAGPGADRHPRARRAHHEESDGYAEAWYLPAAEQHPDGFATVGTLLRRRSRRKFQDRNGCSRGSLARATFQYPNDQRATTLWYHDHTLGMTRLNVYAGPAGFYLLRGGPDDRC